MNNFITSEINANSIAQNKRKQITVISALILGSKDKGTRTSGEMLFNTISALDKTSVDRIFSGVSVHPVSGGQLLGVCGLPSISTRSSPLFF
jgi:hypothetical protein